MMPNARSFACLGRVVSRLLEVLQRELRTRLASETFNAQQVG